MPRKRWNWNLNENRITTISSAHRREPFPIGILQTTAAHIYEIHGNYDAAIASCYEQLEVLKEEWKITEGREVERICGEINRLRNLSAAHKA